MSDETLINSATAATTVVAVIAMIIGMRASTKRIQIPLAAVGLVASITAGTLFWYTHRPLPTNETRTLFQGVDYIRDVRGGAVIVHVVKIDLDAPGIHFMVTPYTPTLGWVQAARTTSQFLREYQLQVAINGDFFDPWRDYGLWDYYPHVGDPVNLRGLSASNGEVYAEGYTPPPTMPRFIFQPTIKRRSTNLSGTFTMLSPAT
ncbi:MAG: hypothetical protein R3E39_02430 [Anaerolineae bacterium]